MNKIIYRNVELNIIQSIAWEREPLMDQAGGTTYECTRVRGNVIVTYNPGAISYKYRNGFPDNPGAQTAGKFPAETDQEIRRYLEQPRGKLYVFSGEDLWLESPIENFVCDVRNGPFVKVNSIVKIPGERLWQINLSFETYINEMVGTTVRSGGLDVPLIISNRWYAHDDTNWQHLRTRTYQGTCVVRGDSLQDQQGVNKFIDSLRNSFCAFSVPNGFQRESVKVTVTPDGNTAHYTVVDTEQLFNKSKLCPAVRIKVSETNWTWQGSPGRMMASLGGATTLAAEFALGQARAMGSLNPLTGVADSLAVTHSMLRSINGAINENLPKAYRNIVIDCWGNQRTKRTRLVDYVLAIAQTRMGQIPVLHCGTSEMIISQDTDNFVRLTYTVNWGIDRAAAFIGGTVGNVVALVNQGLVQGAAEAQQAFNNGVWADPDINAGGYLLTQSQIITNPVFPSDNQTRGTASLAPSSVTLQTLLTQTLEGFNETPAAVP